VVELWLLDVADKLANDERYSVFSVKLLQEEFVLDYSYRI